MLARRTFVIAILSALVLVTSCTLDILPKSSTKVHIVGVALDYRNVGSTLQGTINDVSEFVTAYEWYLDRAGIPYEEHLLIQTGEQPDIHASDYPNGENLTSLLNSLEVGQDDLILFIYSGHGAYDTQVQQSALVLGATETEMLPFYYVDDLFRLLDGKGCQAVAILDCCNSGGLAENDWYDKKLFVSAFDGLFEKQQYKGLHVATASAEDQLSYEYISANGEYHGAFTAALLEEMGWTHLSVVTRTIEAGGESIAVRGGIEIPLKGRITLDDFFMSAIKNMDTSRQTPQRNKTITDLVFIPG